MTQATWWTIIVLSYLILVGGVMKVIHRHMGMKHSFGPVGYEVYFALQAINVPLMAVAMVVDKVFGHRATPPQ
jgi:hypothetical protein